MTTHQYKSFHTKPSTGRLSSLKRRIVLVVVACSLVTIFAFSQTGYQSLLADIETLQRKQLLLETQGIGSRINEQTSHRLRTLEGVANLLVKEGQLASLEELENTITRFTGLQTMFPAGILVFDAQGIAIWENTYVPGRLGTRYADRSHFQRAIRTKKPIMSNPIIGRTLQVPLLSFLAPVLSDSGELLGLFGGIVDMSQDNIAPLLTTSTNQQASGQHRLLIIDKNNLLLVYDSTQGIVNQELPEPGRAPLIDRILAGMPTGQFNPPGSPSLIYATHHLDSLGWSITRTVPRHEALKEARTTFLKFIGLGAGFALLVTLGGVIILKRSLHPLDQTAVRITAMTVSPETEDTLPSTGIRELDPIVSAFNTLTAIRTEQSSALRQQRDRLQQQFNQSTDAILILDATGTSIRYENYRMLELTGYDTHNLQQHLADGSLTIPRDAIAKLATELHKSGIVRHRFMQLATLDKTALDIEVSASLIGQGAEHELMLNIRDISQRTELANLKEAFLATVSHELRTPLTSIIGSMKLIDAGAAGKLPDQAADLIKRALSNGERLNQLINDLLDFSKITSGNMPFDLRTTALNPLIEDTLHAHLIFAEQHRVSLVHECKSAAEVYADPLRLRQVLDNLISNAVKYSPAGGTVTLSVQDEDTHYRFLVVDQGEGIPLEFQPHVFERFSQAESGTTRAVKGTGLGLAISREIVMRMGGEIGFDSFPAEGTSFWFTLPKPVRAPG
ncbi:MAG: sensor histidine kinase [Marinobacter sp.]|nr:sensor histidine kinase [Marinobacter sp.]